MPTRQRTGGRRGVLRTGIVVPIAALAVVAGLLSGAKALELPVPKPTDVCPVCGMFVAKYPEWVSTVVYRDGFAAHFDGVKDLFKYLLDLGKYAPGRSRDDIAALAVTEYYGLKRIDAREAWFVAGSDVLGPMGHELVPLASAADADEFLSDHSGTRILRFDEVNPQLLQDLDAGSPARR
jgi:copper chaperone NosL